MNATKPLFIIKDTKGSRKGNKTAAVKEEDPVERERQGIELPHLVRTVQKSPLAGNIKFLGGEASRQRRLSRL